LGATRFDGGPAEKADGKGPQHTAAGSPDRGAIPRASTIFLRSVAAIILGLPVSVQDKEGPATGTAPR